MVPDNELDLATRFQHDLFQGDPEKAAQSLAEDVVIENFFPHSGNKKSFVRALQQALSALGDVDYALGEARVQDGLVHTAFQIRGVHARPLDFSFMKLAVVPPSHRSVTWPLSEWEYTMADGKIARIRNLGPLTAGMPGILKTFGAHAPQKQRRATRLGRPGTSPAEGTRAAKARPSLVKFLPLIPLLAIVFVILFVPSPIDAAPWSPAPAPEARGALAPNAELSAAECLGLPQLTHPEDLAFDRQGRIYTGSDDGNIYRITLGAPGTLPAAETFATVGGYPLGLAFDRAGNLIVAVKDLGLYSLDPGGRATLLTNTVDGSPITYANAVAIAEDGTIYFSDSSKKYDRGWPYDLLEARPNGRLLAYVPDKQQTIVVRDGLFFPNGVALSPDGAFLLVNETTRYRVSRYWLKGEQQGTWDSFAENLPLLPDNISVDEAGNYLLGGGRRMAPVDRIQPNVALKSQIAKLPLPLLQTFPTLPLNRYGLVLILDASGTVKRSLHDPSGKVFAVSSARSYNGHLYIGTLFGTDIARYPYP